LKPQNIMVKPDGAVKVVDFGLARPDRAPRVLGPAGDEQTLDTVQESREGAIVGTVGYMSPEQALGKTADRRSDIFSLGCVLYEMITGKKAFAAESSIDTLHSIIHVDPPPIKTFAPTAPPELEQIIGKCLFKDPSLRYQSVHDLVVDLRKAQRQLDASP